MSGVAVFQMWKRQATLFLEGNTMIEIAGKKYIFAPDYGVWREGSKEIVMKQLEYIETPQQFCDKIASAHSVSDCYRVEEKEWGPYFNTNVRPREEIFIPLSERHYILDKEYGLAWFRMPWGEVYICACGSSPNDSYYHSYGWYRVSNMAELQKLLLGDRNV
jgi:hypothetical protein